jgi:hypothetical protein
MTSFYLVYTLLVYTSHQLFIFDLQSSDIPHALSISGIVHKVMKGDLHRLKHIDVQYQLQTLHITSIYLNWTTLCLDQYTMVQPQFYKHPT